MIVGTAGHIDHGKTTLVKALTGVDCDRLKEEKARGITLDLGYAYHADGQLGFVDVPGHERLVHNMLAGATGIDYVLLVIAADDGPMPQTREHLAIVDLLDLTRGAVALTKVDAVDARAARGGTAGHRRAAGRHRAGRCPGVPGVGHAGRGRASAPRASARPQHSQLAARATAGGFRHAIDRCFTLQGVGLVVTGTAFSGQVSVGDTVTISPPGLTARVRSTPRAGPQRAIGQVGQRLALNLVGDFGKDDMARGMWVLRPRPACAGAAPPRTHPPAGPGEAPLTHWTQAHLHLGTEDVVGAHRPARRRAGLAPGEAMLAEIMLEKPDLARCMATISSCATSLRRAPSAAAACSTSSRPRATSAPPNASSTCACSNRPIRSRRWPTPCAPPRRAGPGPLCAQPQPRRR